MAPMSYTNIVNHDPPILTVGFSSGTGIKDSTANLLATKECTINIISEWFVEAANYCAIDAPSNVSEWELSGLTPVESKLVKAPRVAESAFVIEAKLVSYQEWFSKTEPGKRTGVMAVLEGVRFVVREDAMNEERSVVDVSVLRPVGRLGGVSYGVVREGFELPRPIWGKEKEKGVPREVAERVEREEKEKAEK